MLHTFLASGKSQGTEYSFHGYIRKAVTTMSHTLVHAQDQLRRKARNHKRRKGLLVSNSNAIHKETTAVDSSDISSRYFTYKFHAVSARVVHPRRRRPSPPPTPSGNVIVHQLAPPPNNSPSPPPCT
ncbi:hypothetical protein PVK06_049313 [Gossypium arboreum]|uniref:Uncharacterized protein n=1 Tax=Gossypium arboreum TaxID=29729 RepID=A0ABR0MIW7_GOSAR|nr:hypothetical protein PVK06_049313 [Gossypium arboreum]